MENPRIQDLTNPRTQILTKQMQPGQDAPRFTAPAYINGKVEDIDLNSYRGHYVILIFYPEDFGAVITTQLIQISRLKNTLPDDCAVLAVSTDSVESHVAYSRRNSWNDWADIFVDTLWWPKGVYRLKKSQIFFQNFYLFFQIFFHGQRWAF